ncbi:methyltransferase [Photobacterium sp. CCB-ST2H9]|uniref:tRNA1(Val) (adenine(37)-N6)-methyltransferase n=1 Tax=Photobacterium sp. CCB-ST2H9 TaxID=2912855 RepID=UPI0020038F0C|nr:methyltransferase [Photobacterium sp. CCB-ST2H9]UTM56800.1 methyltransferase [Photobacterium sp. CCB-ST2H9]
MKKGFTFKQFHVDDHGCGMPVSTDGVLLGAWAQLPQSAITPGRNALLDIGCGSGLLALMAAQRTQASAPKILAVDIDPAAVAAARQNFAASPWHNRLQAEQQDIREWAAAQAAGSFSAIWCNPPYFNSGEQASCQRRATARHTDTLSHQALLTGLRHLLAADGCASLILPLTEGEALLTMLADHQLHCRRLCQVRSTNAKPVSRLLIELMHQPGDHEQTTLTIHQNGQYSPEFTELTRAFYLKL